MTLTDTKIRNTKPADKPIKLTDAKGLYLEVRPSGAKLWRYRYRIAGKENVFAIGEYMADKRPGHISLDDARKERDKARTLVKQGLHPAHQRQMDRLANQTENENTFQSVALEWIDKKSASWAPSYLEQVKTVMAADIFPYVGKLPLRKVTSAQLLTILQSIENRGAATVALLARQWTSSIFRYAVATLRADGDPASALQGAIHRPRVKHRTPMTRDQIADFFKALNEYQGLRRTVIALHLLLLTFVRGIELRLAKWNEIDFDRAEWRVPPEHAKMKDLHIVPLSRQALELLRELHTITGKSEFLFPHTRNPRTVMGRPTFNTALKRMKLHGPGTIGMSAHTFRTTASTMLNEMGFSSDVIERQLAHAERNKVRASYNQAEYMPERRAMMQQWADLVDQMAKGQSKVTPIKRATA